ncbi:sphingomyelin phosphodiesterase B-like [Anthonomus grandis grandis]|uniref:sphingomyelin phosphodiesterase B-like n=1 Tax=Anthonomus grandis grandis TaxID=2921223 RepID=UPI0021655D95|nr:sphingomyelin phosphodiesterase B-like [Anthonomus grandis grandis]
MGLNLFGILVYFSAFVALSLAKNGVNYTEILDTIERGYKEYHLTNTRPAYLTPALSHLQIPYFFRENLQVGNTALKELNSLENGVVCRLCNTVAKFLVAERKKGMTEEQIRDEVVKLCVTLKIEDERVCEGAIDLNSAVILYIMDNNPSLQPGKICDIMLQNFNCNYSNIDWAIDVPEGLSPERPKPDGSSSTYKILHVTDVHMDILYTPNKVKTCSEPLCCQSDQSDGSDGNSCGYWAEYGNDVSEQLIDEMIRFANTLDIDFVYFTGDIISHRVWSTNEANNTYTIKKLLGKLKNGFNVPVYPTLGNHEPSPLNQFVLNSSVPSELSTEWLYNLIETEWAEWLPQSTLDTIAMGGFYTISPANGFRLIVLNSNVAYKACWWLLQDDQDPNGQLDWLVSILSQAEAKNESVHILGHLPTGSVDIMKVWGREYNKIVNRFANTITGQFNGHVHVDTFQVYYNTSEEAEEHQAINVAWNGASLVPYDWANPSFKVYHIDKSTYNVVDIDQWTFNLTKANENADEYPEWYKIYSFRDVFDITTLEPKDVGGLLVDMATNHSRLEDYHLLRYKNSEYAHTYGCNSKCQKKYLCELSTAVYGDETHCDYLSKLYDDNA